MLSRVIPAAAVGLQLVAGASALATCVPSPKSPMMGPLEHTEGDLYFRNAGQPVYLTGSHTWNNLQDFGGGRPDLDYAAFLAMMQSKDHNFMRLWAWEAARVKDDDTSGDPLPDEHFTPLPWKNLGTGENPSFQLFSKPIDPDNPPPFAAFASAVNFDQAYFDRLCQRVNDARDAGIYVGVMLFQGFAYYDKDISFLDWDPWDYHPFNSTNNLDGVDGDLNGSGDGEEMHRIDQASSGMERTILLLQRAYVEKVVDTLSDMDNVLYEISNEDHRSSGPWQNELIDFMKKDLLETRPIGMTTFGGDVRHNPILRASRADWISLGREEGECRRLAVDDYAFDPPEADGTKVIINDNDHVGCILASTDRNLYRQWIWKNLTRGINTILMDAFENRVIAEIPGEPFWINGTDPHNAGRNAARDYLGHAHGYARRLDLSAVTPQPEDTSTPSETGFALYVAGRQYLVYQPGEDRFSVALAAGTYDVEWFDPRSGTAFPDGTVEGGGTRDFGGTSGPHSRPFGCTGGGEFRCDAVLLLTASGGCMPPASGEWIVSEDCTLEASAVAAGNVTVRNDATLTIPAGRTLGLDFGLYHLLVKEGSRVIVEAGGKID